VQILFPTCYRLRHAWQVLLGYQQFAMQGFCQFNIIFLRQIIPVPNFLNYPIQFVGNGKHVESAFSVDQLIAVGAFCKSGGVPKDHLGL
jgi:hypothetical protein